MPCKNPLQEDRGYQNMTAERSVRPDAAIEAQENVSVSILATKSSMACSFREAIKQHHRLMASEETDLKWREPLGAAVHFEMRNEATKALESSRDKWAPRRNHATGPLAKIAALKALFFSTIEV